MPLKNKSKQHLQYLPKTMGDTTSYITSHNNSLVHKMETISAENMQLMEDKKDDFDVEVRMKKQWNHYRGNNITNTKQSNKEYSCPRYYHENHSLTS